MNNSLNLLTMLTQATPPLTIINNKGKNAVLISEEKWNEINETLSILYIDKNENWNLAQTFDSNERW